ncbi:potassium transporter Kup [Variovorax sp. J22R133]|uniref:potassium transporter Kup n=1 Tax=Variovorax brevis TaxID=3053503 RepID=UPI002575A108|nr:potassium transporter Kup [Variovorax sp. J22R133]MDM0112240.1 potassium transporter Kup [Variovorax sp. J22R133]
MPGLALSAIGVVFGDIGTSPLYTMKTVFDPANGLPLEPANIVGVISLIFWSLMVVVSLKYVTLIMRANNHGEGGIMALLALASSSVRDRPRLRHGLLMFGVFGAALFYGDGVITPAISVLSAVEGLEIATPRLAPYVVPITLGVLVVLFVAQKWGTSGIGAVFGPVMVAWFGVLAISGVMHLVGTPAVLQALNPLAGLAFGMHHGWLAFIALGSVVLALTGAEALYADMGHFGAAPIRWSWFMLVFPALALNYLGQGALLLREPDALVNPFFHMYPKWALVPMVVLATVATVIASQAVISGTYSMTRQAIQLGFLPRMKVMHTSEAQMGQIYVPAINWMLLAAVLLAVVGFGSSANLGAAYGIAVTGTMLITTCLTFYVVRYAWNYDWWLCVGATGFFFVIDLAFFSANLLKITQGGWFPLLIGMLIFTVMATWGRGRQMMLDEARARAGATPLKPFMDSLLARSPVRVGGTAIFMSIDPGVVPHALLNNLEHNAVLHERVLFVTVTNRSIPYVPSARRVTVTPLAPDCFQVTIEYGFKDEIDVPLALEACAPLGLRLEPARSSYFLSRATVVPTLGEGMPLWREKLFATMAHNIGNAADYLKLPASRVIELGTRVEI